MGIQIARVGESGIKFKSSSHSTEKVLQLHTIQSLTFVLLVSNFKRDKHTTEILSIRTASERNIFIMIETPSETQQKKVHRNSQN